MVDEEIMTLLGVSIQNVLSRSNIICSLRNNNYNNIVDAEICVTIDNKLTRTWAPHIEAVCAKIV